MNIRNDRDTYSFLYFFYGDSVLFVKNGNPDNFTYSTKKINIGGVYVGGGESVKIQSMCTTKTSAVDNTVNSSIVVSDTGRFSQDFIIPFLILPASNA